jgi:hypothetical protein
MVSELEWQQRTVEKFWQEEEQKGEQDSLLAINEIY